MKYPKFYDEIEKIKITDELSDILGAFEDGIIEFSYLDVVKSAGHSCPTVAGAFLMLKEGLKQFNSPKRGEINVYLKNEISEGTTGVVSNVIAQVTGATSKSGFHGLSGKYDRRGLMHFNADINSSMRLVDRSGKVVDIDYDPNGLAPSPKMSPLMQKVLSQKATKDEKLEFKVLWQERVERILKFPEVVITIKK
jgi:hypothetical protein